MKPSHLRRPDSVYVASTRTYPLVLPKITYGDEFEVRTVRKEGDIKWQGANIFISELLRHESVGLRQMEDDLFEVYFGCHSIGRNRWLSEDVYRAQVATMKTETMIRVIGICRSPSVNAGRLALICFQVSCNLFAECLVAYLCDVTDAPRRSKLLNTRYTSLSCLWEEGPSMNRALVI